MKSIWISKLSKFITALLVTASTCGYAQLEEPYKTEDAYHLFPIKPGVRNTLAGTMGELRSSHFHTGLDIRTEGRTGLPVQASAAGYISRVAVSTSGYGNALYITHPNGHTTVYAHLEKFNGPIADYLRKEQYRRKTADINLYFHKDRFSVDKGEVIAYSGNSGSSGGPHLHYDIRDANNNPINPLNYGFKEILDHTPPVAQRLAIKTLDKYSRVNGQFGRAVFDVKRIGNNYIVEQPIEVYGEIAFELYAYDKLDNSRFRCGITAIEVTIDDEQIFKQKIDRLSFAKQRNILVHMNYPELQETGLRYHKLHVDDGNELTFYSSENNGELKFSSSCSKKVKIAMHDSYKNVSYLEFELKCKAPDHKVNGEVINPSSPRLIENTLVISTPVQSKENSLDLFTPQMKTIPPAYIVNGQTAVYLWDMKDGLPYSTKLGNEELVLNYQNMIPPDNPYNFYSKYIDIDFAANTLFDTLYMQSDYRYDSTHSQEIFEIGDVFTPVRKNMAISLKPAKQYKDTDKQAVYALDSYGNLYYQGGTWQDGRITFYSRDFGKYTIARDSIPPKIIPIRTNGNDLMFKITDDLSGIKSYECTVDDQWVLMHYDYKRNLIWSEKLKDEHFSGEVKVRVKDNAENTTEYIINL